MSYDLSTSAHSARFQSQSSFLVRSIENWQARRAMRSLLKLDDHILRDVGTSRCDVEWALRLPRSTNPVLALDEKTRKAGNA